MSEERFDGSPGRRVEGRHRLHPAARAGHLAPGFWASAKASVWRPVLKSVLLRTGWKHFLHMGGGFSNQECAVA